MYDIVDTKFMLKPLFYFLPLFCSQTLVQWCISNSITLVVVGSENVLVTGIADSLQAANICCFGPSKEATQIESNKEWAKLFMDRHNIPTARWGSFTQAEHAKKFINKYDSLFKRV